MANCARCGVSRGSHGAAGGLFACSVYVPPAATKVVKKITRRKGRGK